MKKDFKPILILIAAWIVVLGSWYFQTRLDSSLFSRSGSMMVLITVVAKQLLLKDRNEYHHWQLKRIASNNKVNLDKIHPTKRHRNLELLANFNILVGTLIWGYGDLLF
jgi:hypothetical protein